MEVVAANLISGKDCVEDTMSCNGMFWNALNSGSREQMYVCDREGHCLYVTPATAEVLGRRPADVIGKSWLELGLPQSLCTRLRNYASEVMATGQPIHELIKVCNGSASRYVSCHVNPVSHGEDGTRFAVVDLRDLSRQAELARGLDLAQTLTDYAPVGVSIIRVPDWSTLYINRACAAILGIDGDDLTGKSFAGAFERPRDPMRLLELLTECDEFRNMEVPLLHHSGERVWTLVSGSRAFYRNATAGMLVFNKIGERRQLREVASYDALTGLPNRNHLWDQLWLAMTRASRNGLLVGVLFVDLDGFKQVNDRYGHRVGDQLLMALARRLSRAVRGYDTVARVGGDEFVILLERLEQPTQAEQVARHVLNTLHEPVELSGCVVTVSASIGIAVYPLDGETGEDLVQRADAAMYRAKQAGPGRIQSSSTPTASSVVKDRQNGLA